MTYGKLVALCVVALLPAGANAAQRAFVASFGDDANAATQCAQTAPCRGFQAAISAVDAGGEVIALDAAGYGPAVIRKTLTLTANPGFHAAMSGAGSAVVDILDAGTVILRGLDVRGAGNAYGVRSVLTSLHVENCRFFNFDGAALFLTTGRLFVSGSEFRDSRHGVSLYRGSFAADIAGSTFAGNRVALNMQIGLEPASASVIDSVFSGNTYGLLAWTDDSTATARLAVARTLISDHEVGLSTGAYTGHFNRIGDIRVSVGSSQISGNNIGVWSGLPTPVESMGDNQFTGNGQDTYVLPMPIAPGS